MGPPFWVVLGLPELKRRDPGALSAFVHVLSHDAQLTVSALETDPAQTAQCKVQNRPSESVSHRSFSSSSSKCSIGSQGVAYCLAAWGAAATYGGKKGQVAIFPLPGSARRMNANSGALSTNTTPVTLALSDFIFLLHLPTRSPPPYTPHLLLLHRGLRHA